MFFNLFFCIELVVDVKLSFFLARSISIFMLSANKTAGIMNLFVTVQKGWEKGHIEQNFQR